MSSFIVSPSAFEKFNGYYRRAECRELVYRLYNKTCQGCRSNLAERSDYVSGHILARRHKEHFEQLFPGLDVDNLLNLHLLCQSCNTRQSAYHFESPFFLNQVYKESARAIDLRYVAVASAMSRVSAADTELRQLTAEWQDLSSFVRKAPGPEFWMSSSDGVRLENLFKAVLRDTLGRVVKTASQHIGTRWGADVCSACGTSYALESGVFGVDGHLELDEEYELSRRAKGVRHEDTTVVGLKKALRTLLHAVGATIRSRRSGLIDDSAANWQETRQSITRSQLKACLDAAMPAVTPHLDKFKQSFVFIAYEQLNLEPGEPGWVGWSAEKMEAPFSKFSQRFGLDRRQAFWLVSEAVNLGGIGAKMHVSSLREYALREKWPPEPKRHKGAQTIAGVWLDDMSLRNAGGLWVSLQDAESRAQLEMASYLIELLSGRVTEGGIAFGRECVSLKEAISSLNKNRSGPALRQPFASNIGWRFERNLDLSKLNLLVADACALLASAPPSRAWSRSVWPQLPQDWQESIRDRTMPDRLL